MAPSQNVSDRCYGVSVSCCVHFLFQRLGGFRCCSAAPNGKSKGNQTPQLLKIAVSGATELLRLISPAGRQRGVAVVTNTTETLKSYFSIPRAYDFRTVLVANELDDESPVSNIDDVLSVIRSDYEKSYFVTGIFTSAIYAEDCTFEDPTIKFQGTELYERNLRLLVPFFDDPSIQLKNIEKVLDSGTEFIVASWKLRTYLKLPWKPLISIDGRTIYDLDAAFKIVRHAESWNISALEAVIQIFTPSSETPRR
ncbi:PREDICTED: uncharacterized protein LOC105965606 [Erythranthe guttata]|uniref:uncharacterized protein LOC105965606 n=1 Tax=Erythranthe guttata TaxID=4155 RepID=UPI00064D8A7F|nr:PREDICTED: uncharacterized protein LOC105965606 [Erythranthe guttata]|eukprot:XP_012845628.1 PREDICTED: uncharacterized protein LOC105965606 [Erythranthe guttata]